MTSDYNRHGRLTPAVANYYHSPDIHGVMDGESMGELDKGMHEGQEFCLI